MHSFSRKQLLQGSLASAVLYDTEILMPEEVQNPINESDAPDEAIVTGQTPFSQQQGIPKGAYVLGIDEYRLAAPFAYYFILEEVQDREQVTLEWLHKGETHHTKVKPTTINISWRPVLKSEYANAYQTGTEWLVRAKEMPSFKDQKQSRPLYQEEQWTLHFRQFEAHRSRAAEQALTAGKIAIATTIWGHIAFDCEDYCGTLERWQKAIHYYQIAIAATRTQDLPHLRQQRAYLLRRLGGAFRYTARFSEAEACYQEACRLIQDSGMELCLAEERFHLATAQQLQGTPVALQTATETCISAATTFKNRLPKAKHYREPLLLGNIALAQGDLLQAEELFWNIYDMASEHRTYRAMSLHYLAQIAYQRGDLERAMLNFQDAQTIFDAAAAKLLRETTRILNLPIQSSNCTQMGRIAIEMGNYAEAEAHLAKAIEVAMENLFENAEALTVQGDLAQKTQNLAQTEASYQNALTLYSQIAPFSPSHAHTLLRLARVALSQNRPAVAEEKIRQAITIYQSVAPTSLWLAEAEYLQGHLALYRKDNAQAIPSFERALLLIEQNRRAIASPDAEALFLNQQIEKYLVLMEQYLAIGNTAQAFQTLERAKAALLLATLEIKKEAVGALSPELLESDLTCNALAKEIEILLKKRAEPSLKRVDAVRLDKEIAEKDKKIRALKSRQREMEARQLRKTPYLQSVSGKTMSEKLRQDLPEGDTLLSYLIGEEKSYLFAVSRDKVEVISLPIAAKELRTQVRAFREKVNRPIIASQDETYLPLSKHLYSTLILPAEAHLSKTKRLLISPHDCLHALPFAALMDTKGRFLIQKYPLLCVPSLQSQAALRSPKRREGIVLTVVDPIYPNEETTKKSTKRSQKLMSSKTVPLPETQEQATTLKGLCKRGITTLSQQSATKTELLRHIGDAHLIHIAAHGIANDAYPLQSAIVLTPEANNPEGLVWAWEIARQWRIKAELVVFSACHTGAGLERRWEGLMGMSQAILCAGGKSVLATFWQIKVHATNQFVKHFYQAWLQEGKTTTKALQLAQISLLNTEYGHPFYWAAFTLQGGGD